MQKTLKRPRISGELRERVSEQIYLWIERNPGHQIPVRAIAKKFGVADSQVFTCTMGLVRDGKVRRLSRYTYETITLNNNPKPKLEISSPITREEKEIIKKMPTDLVGAELTLNLVKDWAKTYKWEVGGDSLKKFIAWLQETEV